MKSGFPHIPALRIAVLLLIGIVWQLHKAIPSLWLWFGFSICCFIYLFLFLIKPGKHAFKVIKIQGGILITLCIIMGGVLVELHDPQKKENYFGNYLLEAETFNCRVVEPPEIKEKTIKLIVEVDAMYFRNTVTETSGKSIIYLQKNDFNQNHFEYGSNVIIKNNFSVPVTSSNPGAFDYKKYLATQGVFYTAYLRTDEFLNTSIISKKTFWNIVFKSREYFSRQITENIRDQEIQGVALALILGNRTLLDPETRDHFAKTGTMHVLAVSGLHVGIFYAILELLFSTLPFFKKNDRSNRRYVKPTIIVICIWFYACIAGLPPSIFRAAVMFTLLAFGRLDGRHINSYNILAASAIILLFINPFMVQEVGFQLSFLAVFGIVSYQPYLYKLWKIKNRTGKYFWSLATVSIAAQLGTAPITIFYFHQFPNYFLLTNMVAIPLAFLVLVTGIFLFTISWIPVLGNIAGWLVYAPIYAMTKSMSVADVLPGATTEYMHWSLLQTLMMFVVLVCIIILLSTKNKDYIYATIMSICIFIFISIQTGIHKASNPELSFLQVKDQTVISVYDGNNLYLLTNDYVKMGSPLFHYNIKPLMQHYGTKQFHSICIDSAANASIFQLENKQIIVGEKIIYYLNSIAILQTKMPEVLYLVIAENPFLDLDTIKEIFPNAVWIFDNSNTYKSANYWVKFCKANSIQFQDLRESGALNVELNI